MEKEFLEFNGLKIDTVIFTQGFVPGCNIEICSGQCCDWGIYMDSNFKDVIMKYEEKIKDVMDEYQVKDSGKWFEKMLVEDHDFASGYAIGTELYVNSNGTTQCVFKDKNNFCTLQVYAVKNKKHKWFIKPTHCILYPLTIVDNTLTYDDEHSKGLDYCGINCTENFTQPVFEVMTEEIKHVLGKDCYDFLNEHYKKNYSKKYQIEISK